MINTFPVPPQVNVLFLFLAILVSFWLLDMTGDSSTEELPFSVRPVDMPAGTFFFQLLSAARNPRPQCAGQSQNRWSLSV